MRLKTILITLFTVCALIAGAQSPPRYNLHVFTPRDGFVTCAAMGITDSGNVLVDESTNIFGARGGPFDTNDAYVWTPSGIINVTPNGLTGIDWVVGIGGNYVIGAMGSQATFRYNYITGVTENLSAAGFTAYVTSINSLGDVCGIIKGSNLQDPAVWMAGTTQPSIFFSESDSDEAYSQLIGQSGAILGFDETATNSSFWIATNYLGGGGNTQYLDFTNPGTRSVLPGAFNASMVAGTAKPTFNTVETILWTYGAGGIQSQIIVPPNNPGDTQVPYYPTAMNSAGQIVGGGTLVYSGLQGWAGSAGPAWTYVNGQVYLLANLVSSITPGYEGWYPLQAWGINSSGQIVGSLTDGDGHYAGFLANPVVEQTIVPDSFSLFRGIHVSGDIASLAMVDANYLGVAFGVTLSLGEAPIQLIVDGTSPSLSVTGLKFDITGHVDTVGLMQTIDLYDWNSGSYVTMDTRAATTSDSTVEVTAATPNRFINANTKDVRARISFKATGPIAHFPWHTSIDQTCWKLTP